MKWPWQRRGEPSPEVLELEESLRQTRLDLAQAYALFNAAADGELVEACVYEIKALQTRYSYLLRRRKALDAPAEQKAVKGPSRTALPVA